MKTFQQMLQGTSSIAQLQRRTRLLEEAARLVRAALPEAIREHVRGCSLKPGCATVLIDGAAWASQARFLQADIEAAFANQPKFGVTQVRFKILPPEPTREKPRREASISPAGRENLAAAADAVADKDLAEALRRLGRKDDQAG